MESLVAQQSLLNEEFLAAACAVETRACALSLTSGFAVVVSVALTTVSAENVENDEIVANQICCQTKTEYGPRLQFCFQVA